jgi:hypothetical protein
LSFVWGESGGKEKKEGGEQQVEPCLPRSWVQVFPLPKNTKEHHGKKEKGQPFDGDSVSQAPLFPNEVGEGNIVGE